MSIAKLSRHLRIRPRLVSAVCVGLTAWFLFPPGWPPPTRMILALDIGGVVFLGLTWAMMARATPERMRLRARLQDEGKPVILLLTVGAAVFSMTAISLELHGLKDLPSGETALHIALAGASILCSWLVTHTMFALHYAHDFYGDADPSIVDSERAGGLEFPGCAHPDYWDFLYFSFVVGMTCQTSDVQVVDRGIRRLTLAQGLLAFVFNTLILALTINIAAGLL